MWWLINLKQVLVYIQYDSFHGKTFYVVCSWCSERPFCFGHLLVDETIRSWGEVLLMTSHIHTSLYLSHRWSKVKAINVTFTTMLFPNPGHRPRRHHSSLINIQQVLILSTGDSVCPLWIIHTLTWDTSEMTKAKAAWWKCNGCTAEWVRLPL